MNMNLKPEPEKLNILARFSKFHHPIPLFHSMKQLGCYIVYRYSVCHHCIDNNIK